MHQNISGNNQGMTPPGPGMWPAIQQQQQQQPNPQSQQHLFPQSSQGEHVAGSEPALMPAHGQQMPQEQQQQQQQLWMYQQMQQQPLGIYQSAGEQLRHDIVAASNPGSSLSEPPALQGQTPMVYNPPSHQQQQQQQQVGGVVTRQGETATEEAPKSQRPTSFLDRPLGNLFGGKKQQKQVQQPQSVTPASIPQSQPGLTSYPQNQPGSFSYSQGPPSYPQNQPGPATYPQNQPGPATYPQSQPGPASYPQNQSGSFSYAQNQPVAAQNQPGPLYPSLYNPPEVQTSPPSSNFQPVLTASQQLPSTQNPPMSTQPAVPLLERTKEEPPLSQAELEQLSAPKHVLHGNEDGIKARQPLVVHNHSDQEDLETINA